MHVYTMPSWAESDTARIAIKLIIHPTVKAFTHTPMGTISSPTVKSERAVDDLRATQLCFSQQGLKGFDVFIGEQFQQTLTRSSVIESEGCYSPFSQLTGSEAQHVSKNSKQQMTLTISPL